VLYVSAGFTLLLVYMFMARCAYLVNWSVSSSSVDSSCILCVWLVVVIGDSASLLLMAYNSTMVAPVPESPI